MRTPILLAFLGVLAAASPASAQKTEDEARLVFTMGLSYTGGSDLWSVEDQPILVPGSELQELVVARKTPRELVRESLYQVRFVPMRGSIQDA